MGGNWKCVKAKRTKTDSEVWVESGKVSILFQNQIFKSKSTHRPIEWLKRIRFFFCFLFKLLPKFRLLIVVLLPHAQLCYIIHQFLSVFGLLTVDGSMSFVMFCNDEQSIPWFVGNLNCKLYESILFMNYARIFRPWRKIGNNEFRRVQMTLSQIHIVCVLHNIINNTLNYRIHKSFPWVQVPSPLCVHCPHKPFISIQK